jgi:hypothetical protein
MKDWTLIYEGFEPEKEGLREALCTLGNGYFATRGASEESAADGVHYPGTYVAGGYDRLKTEIAGRAVENESLVNMPNWLALTFRIDDGDWFDLSRVEILTYRQELDLRRGVLVRTIRFQDRKGRRTNVSSRRELVRGNGSPFCAGRESCELGSCSIPGPEQPTLGAPRDSRSVTRRDLSKGTNQPIRNTGCRGSANLAISWGSTTGVGMQRPARTRLHRAALHGGCS